MTDSRGVTAYSYDGADRLTQVADRTATATNTPVDGTPTADAPCTVRSYAFAGSPGLNGNRTGLTETVHGDGDCTGTGATATTTRSYDYDGADRQTTAAAQDGAPPTGSYAYDPFGRQTLLPAEDAPDPAGGDVTLGYYDSDLLAARGTPHAIADLGQDGIATLMRTRSPRLAKTLPAKILARCPSRALWSPGPRRSGGSSPVSPPRSRRSATNATAWQSSSRSGSRPTLFPRS